MKDVLCIVKHTIAKTGIPEKDSGALIDFIIKECSNLKFSGLMTMAKLHDVASYSVIYTAFINDLDDAKAEDGCGKEMRN